MRNSNKYRFLTGAILVLLLITGLSSCKNGELGWPTDPSYDALFRPLSFTQSSITANTVTITYNKVIGANRYIFELSEDSLAFGAIKDRRVVLADTVKAFSASTSAPQVQYQQMFKELNANTRYSVRMMAVNEDSTLTSKYVQLTFKTGTENILKPVNVEGNTAILKWNKTDKVNHVVIYKASDLTSKNILGADSVITNQEKTDSTKVISNLETGITYYAKIYYNDGKIRERGVKFFKISGAVDSYVINLQPSDNANTLLVNAYNKGNNRITLMLNAGGTYNLGALAVPSGITSLTISCASSTNIPTVNLTSVTPAASMSSGLWFEYLKLVGPGSTTSNVLVDLGTSLNLGFISFEGCNISAYNGLARLKSSATISVGTFYLDNCIVRNIGGTGVLNVAGTSPTNQLTEAIFQQSTFVDLTTQLADVRCQVTKFSVVLNTFYNNSATNKLTQLFRFNDSNTTPTNFSVSGCILGGANGGTTLQSFYTSYTALATYSFSSSYKTSDLVVSTTAGKLFTGINALGINSSDFFVDPANGNFTVKASATDFAAKGRTGDPRWW